MIPPIPRNTWEEARRQDSFANRNNTPQEEQTIYIPQSENKKRLKEINILTTRISGFASMISRLKGNIELYENQDNKSVRRPVSYASVESAHDEVIREITSLQSLIASLGLPSNDYAITEFSELLKKAQTQFQRFNNLQSE